MGAQMRNHQINLSDQWEEQQARNRDQLRRQVWRINYITPAARLEAHIRAETAEEALRTLAEMEITRHESLTGHSDRASITEARIRLARDRDRVADNDIDEEE